jgi:ssRNA-specific RNase YbeY (16S rRNA maturation enzyme)
MEVYESFTAYGMLLLEKVNEELAARKTDTLSLLFTDDYKIQLWQNDNLVGELDATDVLGVNVDGDERLAKLFVKIVAKADEIDTKRSLDVLAKAIARSLLDV